MYHDVNILRAQDFAQSVKDFCYMAMSEVLNNKHLYLYI